MRFLSYKDFREKGIKYSQAQIWRLRREGKFPEPAKGLGREDAWPEPTIDKYIADRVAAAGERETAAA
jgi:predicted DNA-binding transcriptional regulator AlpA